MNEIRKPLSPPAVADARDQAIAFYHPAYPGISPLLSFLASADGGFDYQTALSACCIVAGNCSTDDAWFSRVVDVNQPVGEREYTRIHVPADGVLQGKYFFHVGEGTNSISCSSLYLPDLAA